MMQIRRVLIHELSQASALANSVFRNGRSPIMGTAFPALFSPGISHSFGAFNEQNRLVAFMGMTPLHIKTGDSVLNGFAVGSVCTDPEYRGSGVASALLEQCQAHAKAAKAPLLFISGDRSLYTRNGAVYFGQALRFELTAEDFLRTYPEGAASSPLIKEYEDTHIFSFHTLLQRKPASLGWSVTELEQYIGAAPFTSVTGQQPLIRTAFSASGEVTGIAAFGISSVRSNNPDEVQAQEGHLLEWAGEPASIIAILRDIMISEHLDRMTVTLPWQDKELAELLQAANPLPTVQRNAGTVMILDAAQLLQQLGIDGAADHLSPQELCACLFDPDSSLRKEGSCNFQLAPLPYMYGLYFI